MKPALSKEVVSDSSDDSGSESSGSSSLDHQNSGKGADSAKADPKKTSVPPAISQSESDSSSESESESESDKAPNSHKKATQEPSPTKQKSLKRPNIPSIPAKPFTPPDGYRPVQKQSSESADISKSFSNLAGKQIWHITAPVGVPVKSVKELALDAVATGQSVLSHKGLEYRLREDQLGAEKTKVLLLPDENGNVYRRNKQPVSQTFHVEQVVDIPENVTLSSADTQSTIQRLSKPLPPKPKHLRMRYKPFGSVDDSHDDSQKEETAFREPENSRIDHDVKKRKHTNVDGPKSKSGATDVDLDAKETSPRKKPKKGHAISHDDTPKTDNEPNQPPVPTPDHESGVRGRGHTTEHKKSKTRKDETSQERRQRREEKKRKRRERESAATG